MTRLGVFSEKRGQRRAIAMAGIARAASGGMLGTALAVYVGRDGSPLAVSMLATAFFLSTMVFAPFWGTLGDLIARRRPLLVLISIVITVFAVAFTLIDGVWGLVGLRGFYAVFAVGFSPLMLSIVGAIGGPERRGRSAGFFGSAQAAGDMGGQALVGVLLGLLAPSGLYLAIAAISLLGTIVVTQITEPIAAEEESDRPSLRELSRQARGRVLPTPTERAMLRDSGLGWLYVGLALRHLGVKGIGSLIPIYLVAEVGTSEAMMGLLLTVSPAAQIGLMALLGQQADIGSRKQLIVFGIIASGLYGILLAVAVLPAGMAFRLLIAGGSFLAIAAGFSAMDIGVIAVIGDLVPASRESAFLGLRSTAAGVGGVIGPLSVGILAVLVGYGIAFTMAGVFTALSAIVIVLKVPETTGDKGSLSANAHSSGVETQTDLARLSQLHQQRRAVHPVDDN